MSDPVSHPVLALAHVRKSFGGARALVDANLKLFAGEATALIGENGAGKSTLVKILAGVQRADAGEISIDGATAHIGSPADSRRLGVSVIHQESVVFDNLSVAENIFIDARPRRRGVISWREQRRGAAAILAQLEAPFDPDMRAGELSIAQKHLVQIARGLRSDARVMVMDEPTAALSHHEVQDLFRIVRRLKERGCAVLFISHKFEEIFSIADRYTVFRDGATVGGGAVAGTTRDEMIRLMVGRPLEQIYPAAQARPQATFGEERLRVENLSRAPEFANVSFSVRGGEILGIYGLVGAGRSELMQCLFGLTAADRGRVLVSAREVSIRSPADAIRRKLGCVPEDRRTQGAILPFPIAANISLASLQRLSRRGVFDRARERELANEWIAALQIKARGPSQPVGDLSGGNQQKVVLARSLASDPEVLLVDEPTKGVDVGAKAAVHDVLRGYARRGLAIVMVSSDLPEVLGMADRVLVMRRGRVRALFERQDATPENVAAAATDA